MKYKLSNIVIPLSRSSRHDSCNNKLAGPIGSQEDPHTTLGHAVSSALWYVKHRRKHACIEVYTQKAVLIKSATPTSAFPSDEMQLLRSLQIPRTESASGNNGRIAKIERIITKQKCMHICNSWEKTWNVRCCLYDVKCTMRFSTHTSYLSSTPSTKPWFSNPTPEDLFSSFPTNFQSKGTTERLIYACRKFNLVQSGISWPIVFFFRASFQKPCEREERPDQSQFGALSWDSPSPHNPVYSLLKSPVV